MQLLNPLIDSNYPALTVAYTGTAGATAAYPPGPQGVSVFCTTAAYVVVGEAVTATTANVANPETSPPHRLSTPTAVARNWLGITSKADGKIFPIIRPLNNPNAMAAKRT